MDRLHLIAEIFSRPALWDLQSEEYKSRISIPFMWKEVAASMGPDVTVDECKRKWKNLRDAYRAEIKRIEVRIERDLLKGAYDPKNDYSSKWAYFEHLKFIKDIKRSRRRKIKEDLNSSSNDNYDDDNDLEQFSELHNIDNIKLEPDVEMNTDLYALNNEDDNKESQMSNERLSKETEKQRLSAIEDSTPSSIAIKLNPLGKNFLKIQNNTDGQLAPIRCKCAKRSYDQVPVLEDFEKEEQHLVKSMRSNNTHSKDLSYIGDPDYNFLISFLPQIKKMNELQNLKFRAKMSDFMFTIMAESITNNVAHV